MIKNSLINLIKLYQQIKAKTSPIPTCRYSPTCSQYSIDAINRYGILKGIVLGVKRILKCHPYSQGGHDPVL